MGCEAGAGEPALEERQDMQVEVGLQDQLGQRSGPRVLRGQETG